MTDRSRNAEEALAAGTRIEEFVIEGELQSGGFGVTYLAQDRSLGRRVAIKEYLPRDWGARRADGSVGPRSSSHEQDYRWGLTRFLEEARTLARLDHPRIVRVHRVIEAWGTAYMVMEYVEGRNLEEALRAEGPWPESRVRGLLEALLPGVELVHGAGLIHRDVKPANVMLRADGTPVLIDFGAARYAAGVHSRSLTSVLTPGYAPHEQYHQTAGKQGPWTDVHALGAVAYRALSGRAPVEAPARVEAAAREQADPLAPLAQAAAGGVSEEFGRAVTSALGVWPEDRPQDVSAWRAQWDAGAASAPTSVPERPVPPPPQDERAATRRPWLAAALAALVLAAGVAGGLIIGQRAAPSSGGRVAGLPPGGGEAPAPEVVEEERRRAEEERRQAVAEEERRRAAAEEERRRMAEEERRRMAEEERRRAAEEERRRAAEEERRRVAAEEERRRVAEEERRRAAAAVERRRAAAETALGLDRTAWRLVQTGLAREGFEPGLADGAPGPRTRAALADWQRSQETDATGYLDAQSLRKLREAGRAAEPPVTLFPPSPPPPPPPVADGGGVTGGLAFERTVDFSSAALAAIDFAGDQDVYQIVVTNPGSLTVYTAGDTDTFGELLNASGAVLTSNNGGGDALNFKLSSPVVPGAYYVRVRHSDSDGEGPYQMFAAFD